MAVVRDEFPDRDIAVWAAGGIADGRGVAAALALGAEAAGEYLVSLNRFLLLLVGNLSGTTFSFGRANKRVLFRSFRNTHLTNHAPSK